MTKLQRKEHIKSFYTPLLYGGLDYLVDEIYSDIENAIKVKQAYGVEQHKKSNDDYDVGYSDACGELLEGLQDG